MRTCPQRIVDARARAASLALLLCVSLPLGTAAAQDAPTSEAQTSEAQASEAQASDAPAQPPPAAAQSDGAPPLLLIPVPGAGLTEELASAILETSLAALRSMVERREVRSSMDGDVITAVAECADAACIGAKVSELGGVGAVLVRMGRANARAPFTVTYEVVAAVTGDRSGEPVTATLDGDAEGSPAATLGPVLAQLRPLLPPAPVRATLLLAINVDGAAVTVDGEAAGESPIGPIEVRPGRRTVRVTRAGFSNYQRNVEITPEGLRINIDLEPDEQELARLLAAEEAAAEGRPSGGATSEVWYKRWYVWAGAGGAVLLTAIIIGVAASGGASQQGFPVQPIQP